MIKAGIDAIDFYTSHYYLDLAVLAKARQIDVDKFYVGLGQRKMALPAPDEDIVTMGAHAAKQVLQRVNPEEIDSVLFATESAFDQSKSVSTYVHGLLKLPTRCRVIELKQACYAATAAIQMGIAMIVRHPHKKILVIAADVARYGLNSSGESSQGCGAIAMILSANPRILAIEPISGFYTNDVMDFWRPAYQDTAIVEGKYSTLVYLRALEETWKHYHEQTKRNLSEIDCFCYHAPVPRLVEKAHKLLLKINGQTDLSEETINQQLTDTLFYAREIGNTYTAALYIGLLSLLEHSKQDLTNKRIGLYSYGSGCMAEYFTGIVQPGYRDQLGVADHKKMLKARKALTYDEYLAFYNFRLPEDGTECHTPHNETGAFRLAGIKHHQRQYEVVAGKQTEPDVVDSDFFVIKARAPGKLILSGEYAVLFDRPAIAMAVNRYAETIVSPHFNKMISFNLLSSRYAESFTIQTLREIKHRITEKYQQFSQGKCGIKEVLQTPLELMQYAFINVFDHINSKILNGLEIKTTSTIPIHCGMGSSAASILSVQKAISKYCKIYLKNEHLLRFGVDAERLQHGKTSGLDLQTSLHGGCLFYDQGKIQKRDLPHFPMYIVNTGTPTTSTGECVEYVLREFGKSDIWNEFETTTRAIDAALQTNHFDELQTLIRKNHALLVKIGVVPEKVQHFIQAIENKGAAAKICGAGAINGDNAGIVLILSETAEPIQSICQDYGYTLEEVEGEQNGVSLI
ncbi:MAG: hydroxymethylglutaryl-CoA synthase [Gammaproteobacteria bacterium GWE2_42_36]|nr:MAG: hydroxymethylglutaryl-CoA synthase [Gammaproteobacteria bacterium GWE2_42_36]HCU05686.1 hydroxymethylglutaryl-CoA synthase [Coxiellaceae bacterium]